MAKVLNPPVTISSDQVCNTGRWVWKEDIGSLEFISNNPAAQDKKKDRRQKGVTVNQEKNKRNERAVSTRKVGLSHRLDQQTTGQKSKEKKPEFVTLAIIKAVALDMLEEEEKVDHGFIDIYSTDQFDAFMCYLLNYFSHFYEKKTHDSKPNPMNIEPSEADLEYVKNLCTQLEITQKTLGLSYSSLVLGIGMEHNHHMACGRSRVSTTGRDRRTFETLYSFCTYAVWITFRRKDFDSVKEEMGRILRSETFNPALRINQQKQQKEKEKEEENSNKVRKATRKSADVIRKEREERPTEAEYRRMQGKRPAIKSIINQRSPALVAILPSPKEEAHWLFNKIPIPPEQSKEKDETTHAKLSPATFKIGIIGEPYEQFNPLTLTPIGTDNDEDEAEEGETNKIRRESTMLSSHTKTPQSQGDLAMSRQATAVSQITQEALSDED